MAEHPEAPHTTNPGLRGFGISWEEDVIIEVVINRRDAALTAGQFNFIAGCIEAKLKEAPGITVRGFARTSSVKANWQLELTSREQLSPLLTGCIHPDITEIYHWNYTQAIGSANGIPFYALHLDD
jgi:hypothetical protein